MVPETSDLSRWSLEASKWGSIPAKARPKHVSLYSLPFPVQFVVQFDAQGGLIRGVVDW